MKNNIINRINKFFQNIDLRKFFGTIVGGIFFLCCVAYFTYAYYEWKSDETSIALTIHESEVKCTLGPDVNVFNIGPVLKISDGVKTSFGIENTFTEDMPVKVILDITSISEELLDESFKWAIVEDQEGGENFDYENPIIEGSFKNFRVGTNLITTALPVTTQNTTNYEFIVYIDGTIKNDISMMQNSMEASLSLGNCGEDYIYYDELTQFAFYSADDNSLTFTYDYPVAVGDTYLGKTVTNLYTGYDTTTYNSASAVPWYSDGNYDYIISVTFLSTTTPISTAYWFYNFMNVKKMELEKLDTSNVTNMNSMFSNCSSLTKLDLSNFNTSNVIHMSVTNVYLYRGMFSGCSSLVELNLSSFDTSKVVSMYYMFSGCSSLTSLDLSSFNTSSVENMGSMFDGCSSLSGLDLSSFDTSKVVSMYDMFSGCSSLTSLDLSIFNTSVVENMAGMFRNCSSLTNIDLSTFDTSKVIYMGGTDVYNGAGMFAKCSSLTSLDLSSFNTSSVKGMSNMFRNCSSLTNLDLSAFDTSSVESMAFMFSLCSNLISLNLSSFDTNNVIHMDYMFSSCYKLTTSLVIMNPSTTYSIMFSDISSSTSITLYYVGDDLETTDVNESTENLVNNMKGTNTRVFIGGCYGEFCPSTNDTNEEGAV